MGHDALEQVHGVLLQVVSHERKRKGPATWQGPVKKTTRPPQPKRCISCGQKLSAQMRQMGAWWCERCRDPDGYLPQLEKATAEARDRCYAAYPPTDPEQLSLYEHLRKEPNDGAHHDVARPHASPGEVLR